MDMGFVLTQAISQAIGVTAIIYLLATMGLNIQFGYTGLLNFGQAAFMAVGGYSVAVVVVGTSDEWETEGVDRTTLALPGDQDELVRRVAEVG